MVPIEYLRQFRLEGYAIFDFVAVFIGFYFLAPLLSKLFLKIKILIPPKNWLLLALPIGIGIHLLVGNITPMTQDFMNMNNHYVLKIVILGFLILGLKDIRIVKK